jgi:hypothetical protein
MTFFIDNELFVELKEIDWAQQCINPMLRTCVYTNRCV